MTRRKQKRELTAEELKLRDALADGLEAVMRDALLLAEAAAPWQPTAEELAEMQKEWEAIATPTPEAAAWLRQQQEELLKLEPIPLDALLGPELGELLDELTKVDPLSLFTPPASSDPRG